jgi:hypothetical protein
MMSSTVWCTPFLVIPTHHTQSATWCRTVRSPGSVAIPSEWSTRPMMHCSRTIVAYSHVLQGLTTLPIRTSCKAMMAWTSGALETYEHALVTCGSSCRGRPARLFFMLEAHGPQETTGHMVAQSPRSREAGSGDVGHVAHWSPPAGPEPQYTWQRQSPSHQGGGFQSH